MKKKRIAMLCAMTVIAATVGGVCTVSAEESQSEEHVITENGAGQTTLEENSDVTEIVLSDDGITVNGEALLEDDSAAVYGGADIVYYKAGQDETYGEGGETDGHTEEEAAENTVITIAAPGTYRVTGSLSKGQIAVDLGEDAQEDETAVVNLILDQADITCTVAPAIVVYNAYECGNDDEEAASKEVDTSPAGFNLVLADGSENVVNGSHVAKIYKEGTTKEDIEAGEAKKQWKFDAAIDSLVSFNISGEEKADGKLEVNGDNEGISSALHMTIEGGEITISSADDAINASEDGVSVLTINGGTITCDAGAGKEGDGIDSNGWIIQNGGCVTAYANPDSQDSGIDSDLGIYINGGVLFASGNMYDEVSADSEQAFMVLSFSEQVEGGQFLMLKDSSDEPVAAFCAPNDFTTMVYSSDLLSDGDYTLYKAASVTGEQNGGIYTNITDYEEGVQLQYSSAGMMGPNGGSREFGGQMREKREGMELPPEGEADDRFKDRENIEKPEGAEEGLMPELPEGTEGQIPELPEGMEKGQMPESPEGSEEGQMPEPPEGSEEGQVPEEFGKMGGEQGLEADSEPSTIFTIFGKQNIFSQITEIQQERA